MNKGGKTLQVDKPAETVDKKIDPPKPGILKHRTLSDVLSARPASPQIENVAKFDDSGADDRGRRRPSFRRGSIAEHDEDGKSENGGKKHITFALDDVPMAP
jgi:hypothetical protein